MVTTDIVARVASVAGFGIYEFFSRHLVLVALAVSAAWFYAGHQYYIKGNLTGAFLWQVIAVLLLIAFCVNVALSANRSWLSFAVAIIGISVEIWLIKRWIRRKQDAV
jgi:hypothetical protein